MGRYLHQLNNYAPVAACIILFLLLITGLNPALSVVAGVALIAAVVSSVHHAEVIAHKVGEPFGTLILALAVTVIEVGLIGAMMLSEQGAPTVARDTLLSTVMIVCNGVIGASLVLGALKYRTVIFNVEGAGHALAALLPLITLTLILPAFTETTPGPTYAFSQLVFASGCSLMIYAVFVFAQTVRHRHYFLPPKIEQQAETAAQTTQEATEEAPKPTSKETVMSAVFLMLALVAVVGLAKKLAPIIEAGVDAIGAPQSVVGLVIALVVLAPESLAAIRAAMNNRMQISINLALGSALASIGLMIPSVALLSVIFDKTLVLGLMPSQIVLCALTLLLSTITLAGGKSTVLHGAVHLSVFAAFLVLSFVP